ncbi:MAG: dethiobiotin synthase, partial [Verrucomicrobiae bacterium]|nr:dethiobiotin synthase [Verrucomicrobiae bacterium]
MPFKPAVSGPDGPNSDPARLLRAAGMDERELPAIAPLRFPLPLAPGIAEAPTRFTTNPRPPPSGDPLTRALAALRDLEDRYDPDLTIIEGAGGLLVPMPGGTWLSDWIDGLRAIPLVVGRLGLGTVNHTLLTIEALRTRGMNPTGFVLSKTKQRRDPSTLQNPDIIARASGLPCLGVLPHTEFPPRDWHATDLWTRLRAGESAE